MSGDSFPRRLGRYTADRPGPTVVLVGGLHGNEPAGPRAIASVLDHLARARPHLRGEVLGLTGNRAALAAGRRYLGRDLNRRWLPADIGELLAPDSTRVEPEDDEQRELLAELAPLLAGAREPLVFLDLHSTSGGGPPFTCMADVLRNRRVAFALPIPVILGIEEILDGALLGWLCDLGHVAVGVEGGQNDDPRTQAHHEAALWLTLVASGALAAGDVPELAAHRERLADGARGLPAVIEIRHRHLVRDGDDFAMVPGFAGFDPVARGQVVARDRGGPVRAPEAGLMLMPRYQKQGEDGYFLARPVSRFWLRVSALLRHLRVDRLAPLLPGVRREGREIDRLLVDAGVARFQVRNVFHLLGYRHERARSDVLAFSRRRPGFRGLRPLPAELRALAGAYVRERR
jgi:succinylglutamate desuccinylase